MGQLKPINDPVMISERLRNFFDGEAFCAMGGETSYGRSAQLYQVQKRMMRLNKKDFSELMRSIEGLVLVYERQPAKPAEENTRSPARQEKVRQVTTQVLSSEEGEEIQVA